MPKHQKGASDQSTLVIGFAYCFILVEFALHPQHETSGDSEIQTKEDLKRKFRKQLGRLSIISLNSKDKEEALKCQC